MIEGCVCKALNIVSAHNGTSVCISYHHYVTNRLRVKASATTPFRQRGHRMVLWARPPMGLGVLGPQCTPYQMFMFRL